MFKEPGRSERRWRVVSCRLEWLCFHAALYAGSSFSDEGGRRAKFRPAVRTKAAIGSPTRNQPLPSISLQKRCCVPHRVLWLKCSYRLFHRKQPLAKTCMSSEPHRPVTGKCDSFTVHVIRFTCFVLGVRFVVQLLSLSPVLSLTLWSLLYNIELVFMFSVLFLVFWNNYSSRYMVAEENMEFWATVPVPFLVGAKSSYHAERACEEGKPKLYFQEDKDRTRCNRHVRQPSLAQHALDANTWAGGGSLGYVAHASAKFTEARLSQTSQNVRIGGFVPPFFLCPLPPK